jgi:hypothetical protein
MAMLVIIHDNDIIPTTKWVMLKQALPRQVTLSGFCFLSMFSSYTVCARNFDKRTLPAALETLKREGNNTCSGVRPLWFFRNIS